MKNSSETTTRPLEDEEEDEDEEGEGNGGGGGTLLIHQGQAASTHVPLKQETSAWGLNLREEVLNSNTNVFDVITTPLTGLGGHSGPQPMYGMTQATCLKYT